MMTQPGILIAVPMTTCEEEVHVRRYEGDEGDQQAGEAGAASLAATIAMMPQV